MHAPPRALLEDLRSDDGERQNAAFTALTRAAAGPVDWAYDVWDELVEMLRDPSNRRRAISAQVLCDLAASDPEARMLTDLPALLGVTKDERFVTARHCLQSLWKVGLAGAPQRELLLEGLERRFAEAATAKNGTLVRYDILEGMARLYGAGRDETIRVRALALIETEPDPKYRKKYATLWRPRREARA